MAPPPSAASYGRGRLTRRAQFETPRGCHTSAMREYTVSRLPQVLVFQLQRASYNVEKRAAEKLNQRFVFDQVIYVDRYLEDNLEDVRQRRNTMRSLQAHREVRAYATRRRCVPPPLVRSWRIAIRAAQALERQRKSLGGDGQTPVNELISQAFAMVCSDDQPVCISRFLSPEEREESASSLRKLCTGITASLASAWASRACGRVRDGGRAATHTHHASPGRAAGRSGAGDGGRICGPDDVPHGVRTSLGPYSRRQRRQRPLSSVCTGRLCVVELQRRQCGAGDI